MPNFGNLLISNDKDVNTNSGDHMSPLNEEIQGSQRLRRDHRRNCFLLGLLMLLLVGVTMNYYYPYDTPPKIHEGPFLTPMTKDDGDFSGQLLFRPEQLHLSLGEDSSSLYVTFATICEVDDAIVSYCEVNNSNDQCIEENRYSGTSRIVWPVLANDSKWQSITRGPNWRNIYTYRAKLGSLIPGKTYMYRAATRAGPKGQSVYYSATYHFTAKNNSDPQAEVTLAMYGDLGLINGQSIPRLIKDVDLGKYDAIIHNGDFAYDLDTHHGEYGDEFMRKIEPIAARVPYQVSVGNHEIASNFTYYNSRFSMLNSGGVDKGQSNNFYYSFNMGPVHFVAFSTEFYYFLDRVGESPLRNQYAWLIKDLEHASSPSERALRPWIIVFGHRPMYCSSRSGDDCSNPNNRLRKGLPSTHDYALEKLFYDYGVDVELYSHEHQYERFLPIYDGKIYNGTELDPYQDPLAPVHIISGSAGCEERLDPFIGKAVTGSVKQISDYGYTTLKASPSHLKFRQISDDQDGSVVDEFTITKMKQNFGRKISN